MIGILAWGILIWIWVLGSGYWDLVAIIIGIPSIFIAISEIRHRRMLRRMDKDPRYQELLRKMK